jgi:diacylglycerol kinase family enzyme
LGYRRCLWRPAGSALAPPAVYLSKGHIAVVLNASSGQGAASELADRLKEIFAAAGHQARITLAKEGPEINAAMRRAVDGGCDTLVAGGGDGTINCGASAVISRGIPLGVLPLGTLNHFAKDLGIPLDPEEAAKVVIEGIVCKVDVGEVNGRIFLNNSSLGVYPAIVRLRERYRTKVRGKWIAALWAGLTVLRRNPFMAVRIVVDEKAIIRRTPLVLVANNEYQTAGVHAGTRESLARGRLALYVLNAEQRPGLLRLALEILLKGAEQAKEVDLITVEEATIETRRRRLQVATDGEVFTLESPLEYRIRAGALRVHVPAEASACYPHPPGPSSTRS